MTIFMECGVVCFQIYCMIIYMKRGIVIYYMVNFKEALRFHGSQCNAFSEALNVPLSRQSGALGKGVYFDRFPNYCFVPKTGSMASEKVRRVPQVCRPLLCP